jgi:hypothetical protein
MNLTLYEALADALMRGQVLSVFNLDRAVAILKHELESNLILFKNTKALVLQRYLIEKRIAWLKDKLSEMKRLGGPDYNPSPIHRARVEGEIEAYERLLKEQQ